MKKAIIALIMFAGALAAPARPNYPSGQEPLRQLQLIKLPAGAIKPEGWLLRQMELQRDGLNGHLDEISMWLGRDNNAWLMSGGEKGWEEVPYWLRGYSNLAYALDDPDMLAKTKFWIDAAIASQKENGFFGPSNANNGRPEIWAQMLMLWCLQNYYEYTGDERVLKTMGDFFRWELTVDDDKFLKDYWENSRGGDNMWSLIWYYNQTGDKSVLPLFDKIHRNNADYTNPATLPNWHNVNNAQGFREPAELYVYNSDSTMLRSSYDAFDLIRRAFGQVPGGMFGADENARLGYIDPRQGTETCGFAEQILSDGIMLSITADPRWAANLEDVTFNSFPASMMPDLRSLRYLTCPNHTISDSRNHNPSVDNSGPFLTMNPFSSRCCQHNHGIGWPAFSQYLAFATPDNGLAYAVYSPNKAKAKVAGGKEVTVTETTRYPFEETIRFEIDMKGKENFPLYFLIPDWAKGATATVNGKAVETASPGNYMKIDRRWAKGDIVELNFPMSLSMRTWPTNKNSVTVDYGPLSLSLKIDEEYKKVDTRESAIGDSRWQEGADPDKWPAFEIYPRSAWNYSLVTYNSDPLKDFEIIRHEWPADNQPFTVGSVPLEFKAKGRKVPSWGYDRTGMCDVLPDEDTPRGEIEEIRLIPMGAARLRVSAFPATKE